jgi:hypothetical protein
MQSNDLKRALACLLTSNSRDVGGQETAETAALDVTQILNLAVAKQAKQESCRCRAGNSEICQGDFLTLLMQQMPLGSLTLLVKF